MRSAWWAALLLGGPLCLVRCGLDPQPEEPSLIRSGDDVPGGQGPTATPGTPVDPALGARDAAPPSNEGLDIPGRDAGAPSDGGDSSD